MAWAAVIVGAGSIAYGAYSKGRANKKSKQALSERVGFEIPDEIFNILNATQANASNGLGSDTLSYLTQGIDKAASSQIGASTLLGADPNDLSGIFDQRVNSIMKVGAENQVANLANFSKYLAALNTVAENQGAVQISKDNMIKDRLQAASAQGADAQKTINSGLNAIIGGVAGYGTSQLYKEQSNLLDKQAFLSTTDLNPSTTVTRVP